MRARRRSVVAALTVVALAGLGVVGGVATAAREKPTKIQAELSGAAEVPPADPDGTGKTKLTIDVSGGEVCFKVKVKGTGTPNRGHIHVGAAGVNGGIVVPLFELVGATADPRNDELERGRLSGCVPATPELLADITTNGANYYVNLHNARFPAGAIRAQLG
jgi:hypothetical protein